jgi:pyruvate dehydrogenase phosphatase
VGDSRAVLGSADPETGKYVATALSEDQTGFNPKELERVRNEHPGEKKVIKVKTGRVLGLAVRTPRVNFLNLRTL